MLPPLAEQPQASQSSSSSMMKWYLKNGFFLCKLSFSVACPSWKMVKKTIKYIFTFSLFYVCDFAALRAKIKISQRREDAKFD
jgi:hypothetical protein